MSNFPVSVATNSGLPGIVVALLLVTSIACSADSDTAATNKSIGADLQSMIDDAVEGSGGRVSGISMTVLAPSLAVDWSGASGYDSNERTNVLRPDQPFRIASLTKVFVAAAIFRLHEQGRLEITDPINKYISDEHADILRAGGYNPDAITLRHCLNHTSGIYDYAVGGRAYQDLVVKDPQRRWTRTDQLRLAMEFGKPLGQPGEVFGYSDTGYILLGEAIESVTRTNLGLALRQLNGYDQLQMTSTWLESIEVAAIDASPVSRYVGQFDATVWDPSIDLYGGGGLVSTTRDIATFLQALFSGDIFDDSRTLELMTEEPSSQATTPQEEPQGELQAEPQAEPPTGRRSIVPDYRQGLQKITVFGQEAFIHEGLWGTAFVHIPAYDATIAINYTDGYNQRALKKTIYAIRALHKAKLKSNRRD